MYVDVCLTSCGGMYGSSFLALRPLNWQWTNPEVVDQCIVGLSSYFSALSKFCCLVTKTCVCKTLAQGRHTESDHFTGTHHRWYRVQAIKVHYRIDHCRLMHRPILSLLPCGCESLRSAKHDWLLISDYLHCAALELCYAGSFAEVIGYLSKLRHEIRGLLCSTCSFSWQ